MYELLNTNVLTDLFMQHDTNTSSKPANKPATTSVHLWLIRNQYEIYRGARAEMYGMG